MEIAPLPWAVMGIKWDNGCKVPGRESAWMHTDPLISHLGLLQPTLLPLGITIQASPGISGWWLAFLIFSWKWQQLWASALYLPSPFCHIQGQASFLIYTSHLPLQPGWWKIKPALIVDFRSIGQVNPQELPRAGHWCQFEINPAAFQILETIKGTASWGIAWAGTKWVYLCVCWP